MGFSFHTGVLWTEIPGRDNPAERHTQNPHRPLVKTRTQFPVAESPLQRIVKRRLTVNGWRW